MLIFVCFCFIGFSQHFSRWVESYLHRYSGSRSFYEHENKRSKLYRPDSVGGECGGRYSGVDNGGDFFSGAMAGAFDSGDKQD